MSSAVAGETPVYEVRAMSLAEILDTSFQLVKNAFGLLGGIAAIVYLPLSLVMGAITLFDPSDAENLEAMPIMIALFSLYMVVALVGFPFVVGAITGVAGHLYLGHTMTLGTAVSMGLRRFLPLLGVYLLYGLVVLGFMILAGIVGFGGVLVGQLALGEDSAIQALMIGLMTLVTIVFYFYALAPMVLAPQVVVLEEVSGVAAVRRSWSLAEGVRLRTLGVMITAGLLIFIPISGLQMMMNFMPVLGAIAWGLGQAVGYAFTSAAQVVLYFDIRCRKEAFDLEHLAQLVEAQDGLGMAAGRHGVVGPA